MAEGIGLPPEVTGEAEDTGEVRQVTDSDGGGTVMDVKFRPLTGIPSTETPEPAVPEQATAPVQEPTQSRTFAWQDSIGELPRLPGETAEDAWRRYHAEQQKKAA